MFRHLYGLGTEHPCQMTLEGFNKTLGYKPNNTIQGFGVFTLSKAQELIVELGVDPGSGTYKRSILDDL